MTLRVHIPGPLRTHTDGEAAVELGGAGETVGEVLATLFRRHPGLRDRVLNDRGEVRPHVNVFVDTESIRHVGGLDAPVHGVQEISIVPAVSGG